MKSQFPAPVVSPDKKKVLNIVAWVITAVVLLVVAGMRQIKIETSVDFSWLSTFHSTVNGLTALILVYGLILVKRHKYEQHQKVMFLAMIFSLIFLASYVVYHITTKETAYCGEGAIRYIYFALLISHVLLAAIIFPFILFTFIRAITGQYARHKKLAKIVFPFWLYVAVTGPVLYLMLLPCF